MLYVVSIASLLLVFGNGVDSDPISTISTLPDGRIVGGVDANIADYPHQISMRYFRRHRCGGSILTPNIIVSASHCVIGTDASWLTIAAGSSFLDQMTQEIQVEKYIMHEKYNQINTDYDVAILVLLGDFEFNDYIQPIPLAKERAADGQEVTVTGWGTLKEGGVIPNRLQTVNVNIVGNSKCFRSYPILLTNRMMCAGVTDGGKDACQGDSGGPLIVNNELLGIVSWGAGCARPNYPGVYASVPDLYEWIMTKAQQYTFEAKFL